jgi:protocatechuate 3,4-dioxygenase beta subunit
MMSPSKGAAMRRLVAVLLVLAVIAVLVWFFLARRDESQSVSATQVGAVETAQPKSSSAMAPVKGPAPKVAQVKPGGPQAAVAEVDPTAKTGAIEGRVISLGSGKGVAQAELTFARLGASLVRTKDDGDFIFEPPEPGSWRLAAVAAQGYLPFAPEWGHSPIEVNAIPGRRVRGIVVVLTPAVDYLGKVVDEDGKPIAAAEVRVLGARNDAPGVQGEQVLLPLQDRYQSDGQGEFHFHAPDYAVLEARHAGFAPGRASLDFSAQVSHRVVLHLKKDSREAAKSETIRGRTTDEKGGPLEGAVVMAVFEVANQASAEAEVACSAEATSDPEGRFVLEGLDPGRYHVRAAHQGLTPADSEHVASGTKDLTLKLVAGGKLRGTVTDAETGKAVSSFVVNVWSRPDSLRLERVAGTVVVEPEGRYEIDGLPAGSLKVGVSAPGYAATPETNVEIAAPPAPATQADFGLKRGASVRGTVVDRTSKQPIEGARVTVEARWAQGTTASAAPVRPTTITDSMGQFELTGLGAGPMALTAAASGHHGRIIHSLQAPESGQMPPVTIELTPTQGDEEPRLELAGIGVTLSPQGDGLVVGTLAPGGAAQEAGLVTGDLVMAVDGKPVKGLGYEGTINVIRGPENTQVTLTVKHADGTVTDMVIGRRLVRH